MSTRGEFDDSVWSDRGEEEAYFRDSSFGDALGVFSRGLTA